MLSPARLSRHVQTMITAVEHFLFRPSTFLIMGALTLTSTAPHSLTHSLSLSSLGKYIFFSILLPPSLSLIHALFLYHLTSTFSTIAISLSPSLVHTNFFSSLSLSLSGFSFCPQLDLIWKKRCQKLSFIHFSLYLPLLLFSLKIS